MNRRQAVTVLAFLTEAFRAEVSDAEAGIWCSELEPLDAELAEAAARRVVRGATFFPSIASFREAYSAERRARASKQAALPAERAERVSPESFRAGLEAARATLSRRMQP